MNFSLTNNDNVELRANSTDSTQTVSDTFKTNIAGLIITGCPKVDATSLVNSIKEYQSASGRTKRFVAYRAQLPYDSTTSTYKTTGNYDTLIGYSMFGSQHMSGYDGAGVIQERAALVGTWGITDYIDDTMCEALTGTNGGFTNGFPVISADYRLNWNDLAVQTVDSTKPNYCPAAAIILNRKSIGNTYENTDHFTGKWWLTKEEAAKISTISTWFTSLTSVVDTEGIVSNDKTASYSFTNFDAFSGFTGLSSLEASAFYNATNLQSIALPNGIVSLGQKSFENCGNMELKSIPNSVGFIAASAFLGCGSMTLDSISNSVSGIDDSAFKGCSNVSFSSLPSNLRYVSNNSFNGCTSLSIDEIPSSVGFIGGNAFKGCTGITSLHINKDDGKIIATSGCFDSTTFPIYVGSDNSAIIDDNMRSACVNDVNFASCSGRISSWYDKKRSDELAAIGSAASNYQILKYVKSDGLNYIDSGCDYNNGVEFRTDVGFTKTEHTTSTIVHGSTSFGLSGNNVVGIRARVGGYTNTLPMSSDILNSEVHSYSIDIGNSEIGYDGKTFYKSEYPTVGDGSDITFFGTASDKFEGVSWMGRVFSNGTLTNDFVPVINTTTNEVGFYDMKTKTFRSGKYYTGKGKTLSINTIDSDSTDVLLTTESGDVITL